MIECCLEPQSNHCYPFLSAIDRSVEEWIHSIEDTPTINGGVTGSWSVEEAATVKVEGLVEKLFD